MAAPTPIGKAIRIVSINIHSEPSNAVRMPDSSARLDITCRRKSRRHPPAKDHRNAWIFLRSFALDAQAC